MYTHKHSHTLTLVIHIPKGMWCIDLEKRFGLDYLWFDGHIIGSLRLHYIVLLDNGFVLQFSERLRRTWAHPLHEWDIFSYFTLGKCYRSHWTAALRLNFNDKHSAQFVSYQSIQLNKVFPTNCNFETETDTNLMYHYYEFSLRKCDRHLLHYIYL